MSVLKKLQYSILSFQQFKNIVEELKGIGAKVQIIGKSIEDREIYSLTVGEGKIKLLSICRLHGNEPASTNGGLLFLYNLLRQGRVLDYYLKPYLEDISIIVIPLANPDGAENYFRKFSKNPKPSWENSFEDTRTNASGIDLNRDWLTLSQQETRNIHRYINEMAPLVILDHHEFYFKGGYPPKWPDGENEFMITLTDAPYFWIDENISELSLRLSEEIALRLSENWGHWPVKKRWFLGDSKDKNKPVVPPIYLGSHFPYEEIIKTLIETWGVGLGNYLLSERAYIHAISIASSVYWIYENRSLIENMINKSKNESVMNTQEYVISGKDLEKAKEMLYLHDISFIEESNNIRVILPQAKARMAMILLDRDCPLNLKLYEKRKIYTIDTLLDVKIKKL